MVAVGRLARRLHLGARLLRLLAIAALLCDHADAQSLIGLDIGFHGNTRHGHSLGSIELSHLRDLRTFDPSGRIGAIDCLLGFFEGLQLLIEVVQPDLARSLFIDRIVDYSLMVSHKRSSLSPLHIPTRRPHPCDALARLP